MLLFLNPSMLLFLLGCTQEQGLYEQVHPDLIASVLVPAGTYMTGPPISMPITETLLRREVTLSYSFLVSATELTIAQWMRVQPELPEQFCTGESPVHPLSRLQPVRCVSWCNAILFANAVSVLDGLEPAYTLSGDFTWDINHIECNEKAQFVELNPNASGWRLPTESEWEIAAHAGQAEPLFFMTGGTEVDDHAWYASNSEQHVHEAATKKPNQLGLYDMSGNVFEWTWERFGAYMEVEVDDPFQFDIPISQLYTRPIKGGSYLSSKEGLNFFNRANASPSLPHESIGFRLVRTWDEGLDTEHP